MAKREPVLGQRVRINIASPFECKASPVWITAVVSDLLSTQFVWRSIETGKHSLREGIAFYAHYNDTWQEADEHL